jgi:tetratricopeptide (TPR) repeat protein
MRKITGSALLILIVTISSLFFAGKDSFGEQKKSDTNKVTNASPEPTQQKRSFFGKIFGTGKSSVNTESVEIIEPSKKELKQIDAKLKDIERVYWMGMIDEAEAKVDRLPKTNSKDDMVTGMKNKLKMAKERVLKVEAAIVEDYYGRAEKFFQAGNNLEASLEIQRAMGLDPHNKKVKKLFDSITAANQKTVDSMLPSKKRKFRNGFKQFLEENFEAAVESFRDLQKTNPELTDYLSEANAHLIDQKNSQRSSVYFADAVRSIDRDEFRNAQEYLLLSIENDKNNIEARLLLEQVKLELGL